METAAAVLSQRLNSWKQGDRPWRHNPSGGHPRHADNCMIIMAFGDGPGGMIDLEAARAKLAAAQQQDLEAMRCAHLSRMEFIYGNQHPSVLSSDAHWCPFTLHFIGCSPFAFHFMN
eukprot:scaffold256787_cov17-Tisochrysis_lutea.AAC.1